MTVSRELHHSAGTLRRFGLKSVSTSALSSMGVAALLVAALCGAAAFIMSARSTGSESIVAILVLLAFAFGLAGVSLLSTAIRQHQDAALARALAAAGFDVSMRADRDDDHVRHSTHTTYHVDRIRWTARLVDGEREMQVFGHYRFVLMAMRMRFDHRTIILIRCPDTWPKCVIRHRSVEPPSAPDAVQTTGDANFDAHWIIYAQTPRVPAQIDAKVRRLLASTERRGPGSWFVSDGWLGLMMPRRLRAREVPERCQRLKQVLKAMESAAIRTQC